MHASLVFLNTNQLFGIQLSRPLHRFIDFPQATVTAAKHLRNLERTI
jgi:hypothetical protein